MTIIDMDKMGEALNTKADIDLNNTGVFSTSEGGVVNLTSSTPANASGKEVTSADFFQSNLLNYTTNRILEIPQDIKLELNNGTLTLKAGSKLYYPNGFESDGTTPKFSEYIVSTDYSFTGGNYGFTGIHVLTFGRDPSGIDAHAEPEVGMCYSGTTAPTDFGQYAYWWDLSINRFKWTRDSGSTWDLYGTSLPVALFHYNGAEISGIDQVFNGFGYIGSTVFALPGVKVQIPNGRNEDGSCKSVYGSIRTVQQTSVIPGRGDFSIRIGDNYIAVSKFVYDEETNYNYNQTVSPSNIRYQTNVGTVSYSSGRITSLKPYTVDSVLNSSLSNLSAAGEAKLKSNIQLVNELPANPVSGVLYCIPEA